MSKRATDRRARVRGAGVALAVVSVVVAAALLTPAGPAGADDLTVTNPDAISIPAAGSPNQQGPASPYPSPVTVSGMTGTVSKVTVTLNAVSHAIAADIDVLLVGPQGQNIVLMSDAANGGGFGVDGSLTFDDAAAGPIPATGAVGTGTFLPTDNEPGDAFPVPAPAPSTASALTVFNGTDPNGTWNLFVVDDATGDTGTIAGGWTLAVTTADAPQPGIISFTTATFRGAEGEGPVPLTLERTGGTDGAVSVRVTTGTGTATPGADFAALDEVVTFADGQTAATVPFTIIDDTEVEGVDETVTVTLSDPTGGATVGTPSAAVVTIDDDDATDDATGIVIPGAGTGSTAGAPAAPYPASIHVTGRPSPIGGVEVTLHGFAHQVPIDVDILLVGPGGQNVVLMSDVGGTAPVTGLDLTFTDAATGPVPAAGPLTSGSFTASDDDTSGDDVFPAPAPAPSGATDLATFAGTDPNGAWHLYIVDDAGGDVGSISGGWSLTFLGVPPVVVADAGGPYTIDEGDDLVLDGTGTSAGAGAGYAWDLDGDGAFDDATGAAPTVPLADLGPLGLDDGPTGPAPIALQVTDGPTVDTADTTVTVANVAPTATVDLPATVVAGTPATVKVGAVDPSPGDAAALFTYEVDWEGDGIVDDTVVGPADPPVTHTYATAGDVALTVVAIDKDGAASAPTVTTVAVQPAPGPEPGPEPGPGPQPGPDGPGTPGAPGTPGSPGGATGSGGRGTTGALPLTGADLWPALVAAVALVTGGRVLTGAARRIPRR